MSDDETYHDYVSRLRDDRRQEAARLRRAGHSLRAIGARLGVSHVQVLHDLERATQPTEAPKPKPAPSPGSDAVLDAMSDGVTSTPRPSRSPGWSGSLLADEPQPGATDDVLDALAGPGSLDDIQAGHRTGPDSRFI